AAHDELTGRQEQMRIPDNLPVLYTAALGRIPSEQLDKSWRLHAERKVGMFDTHPSDEARIAAARAEASPGIIHVDAPARGLFKAFRGLCRKVTYLQLRQMLGKNAMKLTFAPVEEFLEAHKETERSVGALESIVGPEVIKTFSIRPMFLRLDKLEAPADPA